MPTYATQGIIARAVTATALTINLILHRHTQEMSQSTAEVRETARVKHCEAQARYRQNKRALLAEKERIRRANRSKVCFAIFHPISLQDSLLSCLEGGDAHEGIGIGRSLVSDEYFSLSSDNDLNPIFWSI